MPAAIFDLEDLIEIMDDLRSAGQDIGTQQYIAAQNLLIALAANGQLPQNPRGLRTWLAPVICSSPREQENFYRYFDRWLGQHPELVEPRGPVHAKLNDLPREPEDVPGLWGRFSKRRTVLIVSTILALGVIVAFYLLPRLRTHTLPGSVVDADSSKPLPGAKISFAQQSLTSDGDGSFSIAYTLNQLPTSLKVELDGYETAFEPIAANGPSPRIVRLQQTVVVTKDDSGGAASPTPTPSIAIPLLVSTQTDVVTPTQDRFRLLRYGAIGFPFLLLGGWWVLKKRLNRALLQKLQSGNEPRLDQLVVRGASAQLFQGQSFRRTIQELRRHRQRGARELDAPRTVSRTIQNGGLFTPSYGLRQTLPEYLVLIDRASFADQQARLEEEIIRRLVQDNVFVDVYYFQGDPRLCRKQDNNAPYVSLQEMAALHPDHHLIVFSDGSSFSDPITGEPYRWLEMFSSWNIRALMTPESPAHWGDREKVLVEWDFIILPATKDGLATLTEVLVSGAVPRREGDRRTRPFPSMLRQGVKRWLENREPVAENPRRLGDQLKVFLGTKGYYWLSACAVYPMLHWDLTLYLGFKLLRDRADVEDRLLPLVRLPWFRYGTMPDWLRLKLIGGLSPDEDKTIRQGLEDLFLTIFQQPADGIRLDIASQEKQAPHGLIRRLKTRLNNWKLKRFVWQFFKREPPESPLRDYVFLAFMSGRKPRKLTVSLPDSIRRLFFPEGQVALGMRSVSALVLALFFSVSLFTANWWLTRAAPNPPPAKRFYNELSQQEQTQFLTERLEQFATSLQGTTEKLNATAVARIKPHVDAYVARIGNGSTATVDEDLSFVFGRAIQYAPVINQVFNKQSVSPLVGLYLPMLASGYDNARQDNARDRVGLFGLGEAFARDFGLKPTERTDVAKAASAAAFYLHISKIKLDGNSASTGGNSASMLSVVWSYELGASAVGRLSDPLSYSLPSDPSVAGLKPEDWEYVPKFLAIAVIGENPRSFRLDMEPLSMYTAIIEPPDAANEIADLIAQFKGDERRAASDRLIQLYDQNKDAVVKALLDAILSSGPDSYRVNLYIARTLGSIKPNWEGTGDQLAKIQALKATAIYQDTTFKFWVDKAISNYTETNFLDCDCDNINYAVLNRSDGLARVECKGREAALKEEFKTTGKVTGTCSPIAQGPNARPKGLAQPTPTATQTPSGLSTPTPTTSPTVSFAAVRLYVSPVVTTAGRAVTFSAELSRPGPPNTLYQFIFGDGTTSSFSASSRSTHKYQKAGFYIASVNVAASINGTITPINGTSPLIRVSVIDSVEGTIPNLVGRPESQVRGMFSDATEFHLGVFTIRETDDTAPGIVLSQQPAAGTRAPRGTEINIVVSRTPASLTTVPDLRFLKRPDAMLKLTQAGLQGVTIGTGDTVIDQDIKPGTQVKRGTRITLKVASN